MQNRALRHFRQQATIILSSSLTSKERIWAMILKIKKMPFIREVRATLPEW